MAVLKRSYIVSDMLHSVLSTCARTSCGGAEFEASLRAGHYETNWPMQSFVEPFTPLRTVFVSPLLRICLSIYE